MRAVWQRSYLVLVRKLWRVLSFEKLMVFSLHPGADSSYAEVRDGGPMYVAAHCEKIYRPTEDDFETSVDYVRGKFVRCDTAQMPPTMEPGFTCRADNQFVIQVLHVGCGKEQAAARSKNSEDVAKIAVYPFIKEMLVRLDAEDPRESSIRKRRRDSL